MATQQDAGALTNPFRPVRASLADLLGDEYIEAVCAGRAWLAGEDLDALREEARRPVDFLPAAFIERQHELLGHTGQSVPAAVLTSSPAGRSTDRFNEATKTHVAPLTGFGLFRLAESGRLHLITKSEHYHALLGHSFPGYRLIDRARALGIPNATHNNTRGYITRLLEERLVAAANGTPGADADKLELNRVLNLETGSLAVEAALKMVLARFHRIQGDADPPAYEGRIPVVLVLGNENGGLEANYHGTTLLTQTMRGMWASLLDRLQAAGIFEVRAIRPNRLEDVEAAFAECEGGARKIAAFFHEIVMMNYGAVLLERGFLRRTYELCRAHDVPTIVDEIQSCMWSPEFFLFREYGLRPTMAAVGKGFPGGEYPASRILFNASMDGRMPQFAALVTNGQEELAALAYLITMHWAAANADVTRAIGEYYEERLREFAERHADRVKGINGLRHMCGLEFDSLAAAADFAASMVRMGFDISAQTYKVDCPPVVLTKLPLIVTRAAVDFILARMEQAITESAAPRTPRGAHA